MFKSKILLLLPLLWAFNSNASLIFSEASDFSENLVLPSDISQTLDVGENYISGSIDYLSGDFYDAFSINLMANTEITHILFQAFDITSSDSNHRIAHGFISMLSDINDVAGLNVFHQDPLANIAERSYDSNTAPSYAFDFSHRTFAAVSGASHFDNINQKWDLYPADSGTSSYRWQYTFTVASVSQVPEPSSILLIILALAGFSLQHRIKQT